MWKMMADEVGELKEATFLLEEAQERAARKYPWWRLLYLRFTDRDAYLKAAFARMNGEWESERETYRCG